MLRKFKISFESEPLKIALAIFAVGLVNSLPSLLNNFPLLYFDSGLYLRIATNHFYFGNALRSFAYALMLTPLLVFKSLLLAIVLQNIALAGFLFYVVQKVAPEIKFRAYFVAELGLLFSTYLLYCNFIMSDIVMSFAPIFISMFILSLNTRDRIRAAVLVIATTATHFSSLLISTALAFGASFTKKFGRARVYLLTLALAPWIAVASVNYLTSQRFLISDSIDLFIFSQLTSLGVTEEYLKRVCHDDPNLLCLNDNLKFDIWDTSSDGKIALAGGLQKLMPDIAAANNEMLSPAYLRPALTKLSDRVLRQFAMFYEPLEIISPGQSLVDNMIVKFLPQEFANFKEQRYDTLTTEQKSRLSQAIGRMHLIVALLSFLILFGLLVTQRLHRTIGVTYVASTIYYILNSIICGLLTDPTSRYNARLVWIFTLLLALQIALNMNRTTPVTVKTT